MKHSSKEKNDCRDARNVATNLSNNTYKAEYVSQDHDIEIKEYVRMMNDFKEESQIVKQHINAFIKGQQCEKGKKVKSKQKG